MYKKQVGLVSILPITLLEVRMKKRWFFSIPYHMSHVGYVEAATKEEALELAWGENPSVCHHCSDHVEVGEPIDGEQTTIESVEEEPT